MAAAVMPVRKLKRPMSALDDVPSKTPLGDEAPAEQASQKKRLTDRIAERLSQLNIGSAPGSSFANTSSLPPNPCASALPITRLLVFLRFSYISFA